MHLGHCIDASLQLGRRCCALLLHLSHICAFLTHLVWHQDADDTKALGETTTSIDPVTGIKTVVEYKINDQGVKVKVTRKIKRTLVTTQVNHSVAQRLALKKFGLATRADNATTTTVGEDVRVKLSIDKKVSPDASSVLLVLRALLMGQAAPEAEKEDTANIAKSLTSKSITCRLCEGNHYTTRCPYKETLGGIAMQDEAAGLDNSTPADMNAPGASGAGGKYVPPSMRSGADSKRGGETMYGSKGNRDDLPTLRITNLSEETAEQDLWDLFGRFKNTHGRIHRIFVGKDQETGLCKGFAFVSFEDKRDAERAMEKINGLPYDHLILACAWRSVGCLMTFRSY